MAIGFSIYDDPDEPSEYEEVRLSIKAVEFIANNYSESSKFDYAIDIDLLDYITDKENMDEFNIASSFDIYKAGPYNRIILHIDSGNSYVKDSKSEYPIRTDRLDIELREAMEAISSDNNITNCIDLQALISKIVYINQDYCELYPHFKTIVSHKKLSSPIMIADVSVSFHNNLFSNGIAKSVNEYTQYTKIIKDEIYTRIDYTKRGGIECSSKTENAPMPLSTISNGKRIQQFNRDTREILADYEQENTGEDFYSNGIIRTDVLSNAPVFKLDDLLIYCEKNSFPINVIENEKKRLYKIDYIKDKNSISYKYINDSMSVIDGISSMEEIPIDIDGKNTTIANIKMKYLYGESEGYIYTKKISTMSSYTTTLGELMGKEEADNLKELFENKYDISEAIEISSALSFNLCR